VTVYEHGDPRRYRAGCRCPACRAAVADEERARYWARKTGRHQPAYIPVALVQRRIELLVSNGWTVTAIAEAAGISASTLRGARNGDRTRFSAKAAARLSAVRATLDELPDRPLLSALGTRRRLQALACNGWSTPVLADYTGLHKSMVVKLRCGEAITTRVSAIRAVRDAYEQLSTRQAPATPAAARSRNEAAARGWAPPGAWAGVDIDDPAAVPAVRPDTERWRAEDLVAETEFLRRHQGLDRAQAAERLGLKRDVIDTAYTRARRRADQAAA
jgi:hypothetical protein